MKENKQSDQHETEQIFELPNSRRDKGRKEGLQEGLQEGMQKGVQMVALEMLKKGLSMTKLDDKNFLI